MKSYISRKFAAATRRMEISGDLRVAGIDLTPDVIAGQAKAMAGPKPCHNVLPKKFHAELDLARSGERAGDQTCRCNGATIGPKEAGVLDGGRQVGAVQKVEELRAELRMESLCHFDVLEERGVEVGEAGTGKDVAAGIAEPRTRGGESEALPLDVVQSIPGIHQRVVTTNTGNHIGAVEGG